MDDAVVRTIEREVGSWPGVTVTAHGPEFLEFRTGRRELGHLHDCSLADLPFPVRIRERLVAEGRGELHRVQPASGWISVPIHDSADVANVVSLFRLNYERPWLMRPATSDTDHQHSTDPSRSPSADATQSLTADTRA